MLAKEFKQGRTFVGKLTYKRDLLEEINKFCIEKNIKTGYVSIIGAINGVKLGYFKQDVKEYVYLDDITTDKPFEIASCTGNISIKDKKPFCHLHIVVSDRDGNCYGGHLMPGAEIFAAEFVVQELVGEELVRGLDSETKLPLWTS